MLPLMLTLLTAPLHMDGVGDMTRYCSACSSSVDQTGAPLQDGAVAADTHLHIGTAPATAHHVNGRRWRYWWLNDRIHFCGDVGRTLVVRDTGGAIWGPSRFDLWGGHDRRCHCGSAWGRQQVPYYIVYIAE